MTLALLDTIARYVTPSKKTTKEWESPCPFCQGTNRFVIQPYGSRQDPTPHAFCRQCKWRGTAINLLQDKEHLSYWDARAIVEGSKGIDEVSPTTSQRSRTAKKTTPADVDGAPVQEWQWAGRGFARTCKMMLWSPVGAKALQWLRDRGMSDEAIDAHEFGFWPEDCMADWGLGEKIKLYRGIVIPYLGQDQLWKLEIRRATNIKEKRYRTVKGSSNALYGYGGLEYLGKAVMVEGVFDAVAMEQALEEACIKGVAVVATGSTNGSYEDRWVMRLALCERVVVAFDSDEGGDKAAAWWLKRLPDSYRWTPSCGDVNAMWLAERSGLVDACLSGFVPRKPCKVCERASTGEDAYSRPWCAEHFPRMVENEADLELYCYECGECLDSFDVYGRAWCAVHKPVDQPVEPVQEDCQKPAYNITEEITISEVPTKEASVPTILPDVPTEVPDIPIPAPPRVRREKPKTSLMCLADGCRGIAGSYDATGGQWCPNCTLRKDLVDQLHMRGFPRLEYSPTHFIEAGEEAAKGFAKAMSGVAISLAVREIAMMAERAAVS